MLTDIVFVNIIVKKPFVGVHNYILPVNIQTNKDEVYTGGIVFTRRWSEKQSKHTLTLGLVCGNAPNILIGQLVVTAKDRMNDAVKHFTKQDKLRKIALQRRRLKPSNYARKLLALIADKSIQHIYLKDFIPKP